MATTSLNGFDECFLKTHAAMTSVMIHSNKTVSHEVKDKNAIQSHMKGQDGRRVVGAVLTFGQTRYKDSFNHNCTIEINYSMCFALAALKLEFTENG